MMRSVFIGSILVCLLMGVATPAHAGFELVSHWTLDEASGTRADSEGDNDLTSVNNTPSVVGQVAGAASFPTASSTYLTIADNPALSTTGTTTFKISLWVKLLSKSTTQVFVSKYASSGQGEYAVYYEHAFQRFVFSTYAGGSGNHYVLANALGVPEVDTWYFIEVTHDGTNNRNTITVNGTYTNALTSVPQHQDTTAAFRIGAFGATPQYFANAVIDDVKFYKAVDTPTIEDLVAHWKFDEGSGTTAVDSSGNKKHGVLSNVTYSETLPDVDFEDTHSLYFNSGSSGRIVTTPLSLNNYTGFTLSGWAYPTAANSRASWFGQNDVFEFGFTDSDTLFCYTSRGEASWDFNPSTFLNAWHYISCLGTDDELIIYVDGVNVASDSLDGGTYGSSSDYFTIGAGAVDGGTDGPFTGYIDDVRVYSRGLTPQEMQSLADGAEEPVNAPGVSSFSPADNATSVATTASLAITFSDAAIATSTGSITIYTSADNEVFESIPVSDSRITKFGPIVTIDPTSTFEESTEYYVWIPGTAFAVDDVFYAGTSASTTWSFTTLGDADGVSQAIEDGGPNGGDGNGDGTDDSDQATVTSLVNTEVEGNPYVTLEVDESTCTALSSVSVSAAAADTAYTYPVGMLAFDAHCTSGATTTVTIYYDQEYDTSDWVARKYVDGSYTTVAGAVFGTTTIGAQTVTTLTYDIADGGPLDADGVANGVIEDPVGPAVAIASASGTTVAQARKAGTKFGCKDIQALNYNFFSSHKQELCEYNESIQVRDLELGLEGDDVLALQKLLNANGHVLASEGAGAVGTETTYFGTRTKEALSRFQAAHAVSPSVGYFGPLTQAKMKELNVSGMWW